MDIVERLRSLKSDEYIENLVGKAADEIERLRLREETLSGIIDGMTARLIEAQGAVEEIERLREALHEWDALIEYTYNGSREAMSAMTDAAHNTAQILYGDPPWPDPKSHAALKGNE